MPRLAKISRDDVLRAALRLVDAQGIEALSMRRLGNELGVEAMSLYRHVPNKEAVLDGVHEAVLAEMQVPELKGPWIEDVRALARALRVVLKAHPNAVPLFATRPAVAEGSLDYVEMALQVLAEPFPEMTVRIYALQTLVAFVVGHALSEIAPRLAAPVYDDLPRDRFPTLASVTPALARYNVDREFAFGLDALLVGLQAKARKVPRSAKGKRSR